jgi:hypothetical protein
MGPSFSRPRHDHPRLASLKVIQWSACLLPFFGPPLPAPTRRPTTSELTARLRAETTGRRGRRAARPSPCTWARGCSSSFAAAPASPAPPTPSARFADPLQASSRLGRTPVTIQRRRRRRGGCLPRWRQPRAPWPTSRTARHPRACFAPRYGLAPPALLTAPLRLLPTAALHVPIQGMCFLFSRRGFTNMTHAHAATLGPIIHRACTRHFRRHILLSLYLPVLFKKCSPPCES